MSSMTLRHMGTQAVLPLTDRLIWVNEFAHSPVAQEARWGTTGALMLHVAVRQAGRPIELDGHASQAFITRADCAMLHDWAAQRGQSFELTLRGQTREVVFDHTQPPAFQAEPLWLLLDGEQTPEQVFVPRLRFMEI